MVYVKPPASWRWSRERDHEQPTSVDHYHMVLPRDYVDTKHYWMLDYECLRNLEDDRSEPEQQQTADHSRLRYLSGRHYRNLLNYEYCHDEELRRFVRDRNLQPNGIDTGNRHSMINALEYQDEHGTTFAKLLGLPTELRLLIYTKYLESFPTQAADGICTPPPLAEVCRKLRAEVLPQFYSDCTFKLTLYQDFRNGWITLIRGGRDERLLTSGPKRYLVPINKVLVDVQLVCVQGCLASEESFLFRVELPTSTRPGRVSSSRRDGKPIWLRLTPAGIQANFRARLKSIGSGPQGTYPPESRSSALEEFANWFIARHDTKGW